jgi:hypothetical protein
MTAHADADTRLRTYQRLTARNRIVAILRIGVPAIGIVVLVGLIGQIYLSRRLMSMHPNMPGCSTMARATMSRPLRHRRRSRRPT